MLIALPTFENLPMRLFPELHEILFPSRCLGCLKLNRGLCSICGIDMRLRGHMTFISGVPIFSATNYSKTAGRILLASKEDGIVEADEIILKALSFSLRNVRVIGLDSPELVPIPSSPSSNRRRGRKYVDDLSMQLSAIEGIRTRDILFHSRKVIDQSRLSASARAENLTGAMSAARGAKRYRPLIVIDDLLTTGATFSEALRALKEGGYTVAAGITAFLAQPLR